MRLTGRRTNGLAAMAAAGLAALMPMLGGCTTVKATFPGESPEAVWTAMVAVAESPGYDTGPVEERWRVEENAVMVDRENARIEIYRQLRRTLHLAGARPWTEGREWRFRVVLEELEPPLAVFTSRGLGVPAHAKAEGERYFDDVRALLDTEALEGEAEAMIEVEREDGSLDVEPGAAADELPEPAIRMEDLEPDEPSDEPKEA